MSDSKQGGMYRVYESDDPPTAVAKLKANCGTLLVNRPPGYKAKIRDMDDEITRVMQRAAAHPKYADDLVTTRVTAAVRWLVPKADVDAMFALPCNTQQFDDAVLANGGQLVEFVPIQMKSWAYTLEQPVLDELYFTVGALCTHVLATRLCSLLHAEYAHEIRIGQLAVSRECYGFHFPTLMTVQDAEAYLREKARAAQCR